MVTYLVSLHPKMGERDEALSVATFAKTFSKEQLIEALENEQAAETLYIELQKHLQATIEVENLTNVDE